MKKEIEELLKYISEKLSTQDNFLTDTPLYIVQTETTQRVAEEDFYYANGKIEVFDYYNGIIFDSSKKTIEEFKEEYAEFSEEEGIKNIQKLEEIVEYLKKDKDNISISFFNYVFKDVAYFILHEDALAYMNVTQKHNLENPRIFVNSLGYSNNGALYKLLNLLKKQ